jgi:hypothetical protein
VKKILSCIASTAILICQPSAAVTSINSVYFAQTHVQKTTDLYYVLVGNRETLIKAHVIDPATPASPAVTAVLTLNGNTLNLPLTGPAVLPASIPDGPGVIQHTNANSFTAIIPAAWVKPGLTVTVQAGSAQASFPDLRIGAPTKVIMTMTDIHFFTLTPGDYPNGWETELEAKWPVSRLEVRRADDVVFPELVMPPRSTATAVRVTSKQDYVDQTGIAWDGENSAATAWNVALRRAAGRTVGYSLYYLNKYNVANEGVAGGFSGVGTGNNGSRGILHHELGHALSLPHWGDNSAYPYKGAMHGISPPPVYNETHAGPTWAFHLPTRAYIPCTIQATNVSGATPGTYKQDPMQGGGIGHQESDYIFNHFSDYSVLQMKSYLESIVVVWNETLGSYAKWNATTRDYTTLLTNNGVQYPLQRDQSVISIMASVSGASPDVCMVYPPIGPYTAGLIRLFDPTNAADRAAAASTFAPTGGCDATLRITQGGVVKTFMLAASYDTTADPQNASSLFTEAVNIPAAGGTVTKVELLLTPDAQINGLPANPQVLYTWTPAAAPTPNPTTFTIAPNATGPHEITMTAATAVGDSDFNGSIEYLFTETSGNLGGTSSAWQSSPVYTDTNLQPNTTYRYTVTVRSGISKATGSPSVAASATTTPTVATKTIQTTGGTNSWTTGTWSDGIPTGTLSAEIAPGIAAQNSVAIPTWSGPLTLQPGSSLRINAGGENLISSMTSLTLNNATIYDTFGVVNGGGSQTFPPIILNGGGTFDTLASADPRLDTRIFAGVISGNGGFSTKGRGLTTYRFNNSNPFTGGLTINNYERHVIELNAAMAAGYGNVTVNKAAIDDDYSGVLRLGANNVFHPHAILTLNGKGWNGVANFDYGSRFTRLDMKTFNATVAKLIIDGVEQAPGTYTGTSTGTDWIDGSTGILTVTGVYGYFSWIADHPTVGTLVAPGDNPDNDSLNNLQEYAFGTNPTTNSSAALSYMPNGAVTQAGAPIAVNLSQGGGVDYRAIFTRRKNHLAAGLTYTVQFSADLIEWFDSTQTPAVLTGSSNPSSVEVVSVPYPNIVETASGPKKPTFFRVKITMP